MSAEEGTPLGLEPTNAYQAFFSQVEQHWSWRRGNQIIVSPVEFEAIEAWYQQEVPLVVICRAIDVFVEKKQKRGGNRPFYLTHLDTTVQKVLREYVALQQGAGSLDESEDGLLQGKLSGLVRKLKQLAKSTPVLKATIDPVIVEIQTVDTQNVVQFEEIEGLLGQWEDRILLASRALLTAEEKEGLEEEAESIVPRAEDEAFFHKIVKDLVRAHFGLPRLTILG